MPWDKEAVLASVRKTSKVIVLHEDTRTGGFGAEIAATIAEEAFEDLDAPPRRVTAPDTPVPFAPVLEAAFLPQVADVVAGAARGRGVLGDGDRDRRRGRDAPDGRLRLGGDGHAVAARTSATRSRPTSRCSRSRPTRSTPRCRAPGPACCRRSSSRRARRCRSGRSSRGSGRRRQAPADRPRGHAACAAPVAAEPEPVPQLEPRAGAEDADRTTDSTSPSLRRSARRAGRPAGQRLRRSATRSSRRSSRGSPPSTASTRRPSPGTGRDGRVTKKDILAFVESEPRRDHRPRPARSRSAGAPPACRPRRPPAAPAATPPAAAAPGRCRAAAESGSQSRRDARADERDAARDRRAHAPLARHRRARHERDRGRHVEGGRDPASS